MEKQEVVTAKAPAAIGPYSQAIVAGDFVFTSGVIPADAKTGIIPASVDEQFMRALHNLREVLVAAGSDQDHVIRTTVYMKDLKNFDRFNELYGKMFHNKPLPARSCVQVAALPKDVECEIEATALLLPEKPAEG
ncbi:MAG: Rid family detoxifying hydrolase [Lachnospiraceae bacterium]|nr:Rid family detoxifying hydrolase [Lachnospiraceae bacterium]